MERKKYSQKPGYWYVETKTPAIQESINRIDAAYGDALHKVTMHVGDADAVFKDNNGVIDFYESIIELRSQISSDAKYQRKIRKKVKRILNDEALEWSGAVEQKELENL